MEKNMVMTEGDIRVGSDFNPSGINSVDEIKSMGRTIIDYVLGIQRSPAADAHERRWAAEAATHFETGTMFAVKALTHEPCEKQFEEL